MPVTAGDLVEETRGLIYSGQEAEANRLNGTLSGSAITTSFNVKYPLTGITRGAVLAVDLEEIRVWETSGTFSVSACERGANGTTPAAHSDLAYVEVRPKFSRFRILRAINQDLDELCSPVNGLYTVGTVDLTYNPSIQGYDLTGVSDVIDILEVRFKLPGPSQNWPVIRSFQLSRKMDTTIFPPGMALFLYESGFPGLPIRVNYSTSFTSLASLTDDVQTTTGLPASANVLPPIGAAISLVAPREINRNFTEAQFDPHRLEEIPAGAVLASTRGLQLRRQQLIMAEQAKLTSNWPMFH